MFGAMGEPKGYRVLETRGVPVKAWTVGVPCDPAAERQLANAAALPIVFRWVAAMPDVHVGIGATVGAVIPTVAAIIPAAVGVDIGCGMSASLTSLTADDLPSGLGPLRAAIERAVPHGRTDSGGRNDRGAWHDPPPRVADAWRALEPGWRRVLASRPALDRGNHPARHLGTLGTGNHFIELCLDEAGRVWILLHSGSRGVGNRIGTDYIEVAREEALAAHRSLPDRDLAWLDEGTESFDDYVAAVGWAQEYARTNRDLMLLAIEEALARTGLGGYLHTPAQRLSAGQKRRIALARLLLSPATLWILDEPFTAIDLGGVAELEQLIAAHAAGGGAVLLTTHHRLAIAQDVRRLALGAQMVD